MNFIEYMDPVKPVRLDGDGRYYMGAKLTIAIRYTMKKKPSKAQWNEKKKQIDYKFGKYLLDILKKKKLVAA